MKKNRFLKVASAMIILCLITTCAVSATFAKYTTAGSANDQARVAKWGVELTMDADPAFASEYTNTTNGLTVQSENGEKVVAPGTSSSEVAGGLRFAITGTPEVKTNIDIAFTFTSDVYLKAGTYYDGTQATKETDGVKSYETFDLGADYYPVVFTLKQMKDANGDIPVDQQVLETGNLAKIKAFLDAYSTGDDSIYAPNTDLGAEFELTWEWAIDKNDAADTLLGNLAAGTLPTYVDVTDTPAPADYSLNINYSLTITVTQMD